MDPKTELRRALDHLRDLLSLTGVDPESWGVSERGQLQDAREFVKKHTEELDEIRTEESGD